MSSSAEQIRNWNGPAILGYGFRPFFLGAAVFAGVAMAVWIGALAGLWIIPSAFGPIEWHAHEFLWGYLSAVVAGFMLTAVPNWTGRLPIVGHPLALLWSSWALGRIAVFFSAGLPPLLLAGLDLLFLALLISMLGREIVAGRNWRNLKVLAMVGTLLTGNAVFHLENLSGEALSQGYGIRLGIGSAILLIAVIGGRIIPSFTRNWLARRAPGRLPEGFSTFDKAAIGLTAAALLLWVARPGSALAGILLLAAGAANLLRLARWAGWRSLSEPLVSILHAAYLFVPLGFLLVGSAALWPEQVPPSAAIHAWTAGAILLMTLAVMTRASLGHSGMPLTADRRITAIYVLALVAALSRIAAGLAPGASWLLEVAGLGWILAFLVFVAVYAPLFLKPRRA
ncbi:NnrS family protein [Aestuariivirga sp.]|uniref:NnrS family protein n=1 Tax=Aestuariivirga sp. TaxID=2650926 RepID=UPI00391DFB2A